MNELFGIKHIILIVISLAVIIGGYFLTRKWKFESLCKSLLVIAIISEIIKTFTYIVLNEDKYGGLLPKNDLPFQLCSIQLILVAIVVFAKKEKLKRVILSFMMPSCLFGGLAAILIATSSSLNVWVITIQYFFYHVALCVFALHLLARKEFKWDVKDYASSLIFIVGMFFFAIYMNSMMYDGFQSTNFMYVVNPPQKNLPYLNENQGWLMYMVKYASLVLLCITLCYIKPIILAIRNKCKKQEKDTNK